MNNNSDKVEENLQQIVLSISKAYSSITATQDKEPGNSIIEIEKYIQKIPAEFKGPTQYHAARFYALTGDTIQANKILQQLIINEEPLPEVYWLAIQLNSDNKEFRWKMEDKLGRMLPLTAWGRLRDAKLQEREALKLNKPLIDNPGPVVPRIESDKLFKIAHSYQSMNVSREAANAYREAIYSEPPPGFPNFGEESWISKKNGSNWLLIAQNETALAHKKAAFQALLFAVASSPNFLEEATKLITEQKEVNQEPLPDLEKFDQIASLYKECNIHPRAIEALTMAETMLKLKLADKIKNFARDWGRLIEEYAKGGKEISFLFGLKVSDEAPEKLIPKKLAIQ